MILALRDLTDSKEKEGWSEREERKTAHMTQRSRSALKVMGWVARVLRLTSTMVLVLVNDGTETSRTTCPLGPAQHV